MRRQARGARSTETDTVETETETTPTETTPTETETTPTETTDEPTEELPPGQDGELPPGQDDGPDRATAAAAIVPEGGRVSPPQQIAGRYVIERRLGAGGMSTVFLATDTVLERPGGGEAAGRAPGGRRRLRGPLPPRGARRRAAPAPERRPGVRLGRGPREPPPLHRHGVRGRALLRRPAARAQAAGRGRDRAHGARRLPRARLRAPRRGRAPRREARQPARRPRR